MTQRLATLRARLGGFAFGGDYNPEQWDRAVWDDDVELMKRAGVNLVTLGVFAWSSLEPEPGRFTLGWLDEVMDLLHAGGAPAFVEVARRFNERAEFLFLLNHSDTETATVSVRANGVDLLSGTAVDGSVVLTPLAVAVVRSSAEPDGR